MSAAADGGVNGFFQSLLPFVRITLPMIPFLLVNAIPLASRAVDPGRGLS